MGGDDDRRMDDGNVYAFQSTPPHGGRPEEKIRWEISKGVSIHAPAWGATVNIRLWGNRPCKFQSTPPHGGRRIDYRQGNSFEVVSIHAPAWGAPSGGPVSPGTMYVSIHAPAGGATGIEGNMPIALIVTTHAPAWGATLAARYPLAQCMFQSTPPHGGRLSR